MSIRILFVDPDENLLETYRHFFEGRGFEVVTAAGGADGERALDRRAPDVVVLEPDLPDRGGPRLLEKISRTDPLADVPVLVLTRRDPVAFDMPVRMTLIKPVSLRWLAETIQALVSGRTQGVIPGPARGRPRAGSGSPAVWRSAAQIGSTPPSKIALAGL